MKKILFFLTPIFLLILSLMGFSNIDANNQNKRKAIKIVIVNSYFYNHPCTSPQVEGFRHILEKLSGFFRTKIFTFDMKTKTTFISKEQQEYAAQRIIDKINKIKPDIIFTTDDNACKFVGIPLSTKYYVISSGLNKFPELYIKEFNLKKDSNSIVFISEYMKLDNMWNFFDQNNFFVNNIYIITEDERNNIPSITSYYLYKNYIDEFRGRVPNIETFKVSNINQLRQVLMLLNNKSPGILVPVIQRIKNENGLYENQMRVIKEIIDINMKHLELGGNPEFCKFGLSICSVPSFISMGEISAAIVYNYFMKKIGNRDVKLDDNCSIITPTSKLYVNKERLDQLGYINLLEKFKLINKVYEVIKPMEGIEYR